MSRARRDRFSGLAGSARPGGGGNSPGRALALLLGAVGLGSLAFTAWAGSGKPRAEVVRPATVIGRQTPFSVRSDGGRAGLRSIIVRLEGAAGAGRLFEKEIPADGLLGSGVRSECLDMVLYGSTAGVAEGDAVVETTADGLFTLKESECQGACGDAPVLLVNNQRMCSFMSADRIDALLIELKSKA